MTELNVVNMTPHSINLPEMTIESSGRIARVIVTHSEFYKHPLSGYGGATAYNVIPTQRVVLEDKDGKFLDELPREEAGTFYIVSGMCKELLPEREDLISPTKLIRNEKGWVVGAEGLSV